MDQDQTEWSKNTFEPLVTDKVKEMFTSVEQNVENFFVDIDKIRVEISGGDVTDVANDVPLRQRIADLDGGFLVDDTDLMEVDGQSEYFSFAIISFLNPGRSVGAILNGGFVWYQREIIVIKVKAKMAHTVTEKINQFPFEVIDKILDNLKAKITKLGNTIVSAMDTELSELRKQVDIRY